MKYIGILGLTLLLSTQASAKLTVHEWGTFTSLVGSDGKAQNGMYHEDEPLPKFVHNFGDPSPLRQGHSDLFAWIPPQNPHPDPEPAPPRCVGSPKVPCEYLYNQTITQKMETPVVYFYSDEPQKVTFDVSFPGGIISQSYPAASAAVPQAIPGVELKNGFAHYDVNILKNSTAQPPFVEASNIYSHARNVASDPIQVGQETEKFIFYRGLGEFKTKLTTTSKNGNLKIENNGRGEIPEVILLYTDGKGHGDFLSLGHLEAQNQINLSSQTIENLRATKETHGLFLAAIRRELFKSLVTAGLFADEAKSMIDTWENGYFKTPGLRILYVLNRQEIEEILPVQVSPRPDELNRVFVGRIELLLDTDEERILSQIIKLQRQYDVSQLGRMAQPTLLRIEDLANSKGLLSPELSETIDFLISQIH